MKMYIYGLKNRLVGLFEKPFSEAIEPKDYSDQLALSLSVADPATLNRYKEYDLHCLGILDSKTGEIVVHNDFLISLEPICLRLIDHINSENVGKDGKEAA